MPPPNPGELTGLRCWDFKIHDGYSIRMDGARTDISRKHCHPHFEIFWIRRGEGVFYRNGELTAVGPQSILIVGPGDVHYWRKSEHLEGGLLCVSEQFTSSFNFALPFAELASFLQPHGTRVLKLNPTENGFIQSFFQLMEHPGEHPTFEPVDVIKALLLVLFGKLKGFYASLDPHDGHSPTLLTRRFEQALQSEFPRLVSVKEFAQHLDISRSYLHRAVLRDTGKSPSQLIHERIVTESKRLLLHTNSSPAEIAAQLGFASASYFSRFFRRQTSLNPRSFRSRGMA